MQRILVIDDDLSVTSVLKRGLTLEGFAVDVAGSGTEGLATARARASDLVLLDIMMPGIDGLTVLERFRAADATLPVLLLTAKDTPAEQVRGLDLGADDYVVKPFTWEFLLARIRALLRRHETDKPAVLRFADLRLDTGGRQARRGASVSVLAGDSPPPLQRDPPAAALHRDRGFFLYPPKVGVVLPPAATPDDQPVHLHDHRCRLDHLVTWSLDGRRCQAMTRLLHYPWARGTSAVGA